MLETKARLLTDDEIAAYRRDGYVVPADYRLPQETLDRMELLSCAQPLSRGSAAQRQVCGWIFLY